MSVNDNFQNSLYLVLLQPGAIESANCQNNHFILSSRRLAGLATMGTSLSHGEPRCAVTVKVRDDESTTGYIQCDNSLGLYINIIYVWQLASRIPSDRPSSQ